MYVICRGGFLVGVTHEMEMVVVRVLIRTVGLPVAYRLGPRNWHKNSRAKPAANFVAENDRDQIHVLRFKENANPGNPEVVDKKKIHPMTINSTNIIYGVVLPVAVIHPIVEDPITEEEKADEDDILANWMYNTYDMEGFFVKHVPHDQADDEKLVVVGIKICDIQRYWGPPPTYAGPNLLEQMKKSVIVAAEYEKLLGQIKNKALQKLLSEPSTHIINDDCGCCS